MPTPVAISSLLTAMGGVYRGGAEAIELLITAFLAGGHVLIEDIPGVGKTTLARALAQSIGGSFRRLQCTPDLMPTDVTGVSIYDERERSFIFHPGPVFCDVLLADELNRTPPRTQSALLEALSEGQVTVEGTAKPLSRLFFCVATQNPLDHVGTYPLPDSQRDRFLLSFRLGYPEAHKSSNCSPMMAPRAIWRASPPASTSRPPPGCAPRHARSRSRTACASTCSIWCAPRVRRAP